MNSLLLYLAQRFVLCLIVIVMSLIICWCHQWVSIQLLQCFTDKFTAAVRQKPNNESHIMLFCSALVVQRVGREVRGTVQARHGVNTDQNTSLKRYNFCEIPPELFI